MNNSPDSRHIVVGHLENLEAAFKGGDFSATVIFPARYTVLLLQHKGRVDEYFPPVPDQSFYPDYHGTTVLSLKGTQLQIEDVKQQVSPSRVYFADGGLRIPVGGYLGDHLLLCFARFVPLPHERVIEKEKPREEQFLFNRFGPRTAHESRREVRVYH